ncbi:MAG: septal ring lytic transglycosylase RlpA family protein [Campylobacterales bacterium]|nr:septal ring lytic transglycosylase RlpA family protein [Campylobacterales bacterium]
MPSTTPFVSGGIIDTPQMHRATMRSYTINGKTYHPTTVSHGDSFSGIASWYGKDFHGKKTSNGEIYNMYAMTAAHKTLPMNTMVRVTHLHNGKSIVVRINDRGPFVASRIIDLSYTGAQRIDMIQSGTAPVRLDVIGFGGSTGGTTQASQQVEGGEFLVQIGAFRRLEGARSFAKDHQMEEGRYPASVQEDVLDGSPIYRVYLGGFRSEDEARDFIGLGRYQGSFVIRDSK